AHWNSKLVEQRCHALNRQSDRQWSSRERGGDLRRARDLADTQSRYRWIVGHRGPLVVPGDCPDRCPVTEKLPILSLVPLIVDHCSCRTFKQQAVLAQAAAVGGLKDQPGRRMRLGILSDSHWLISN